MKMPIQIEICIQCPKHAAIVSEELEDLHNITVSTKSLNQATHPILIVPGNCYAKKGEQGIAGFILDYLVDYGDLGKPDIIDIVRAQIAKHYNGYLPIGQSILVPIDHHTYKHIVYMPLREDPKELAKLDSVFIALRGALNTLEENGIEAASMPMLNFIYIEQQSEITERMREAFSPKELLA